MRATIYIQLVSLFIVFTSSCVSKKVYDDLNVKKSSLEVDNADLKEEATLAEAENQRLSNQVSDYTQMVNELVSDTSELGTLYRDLIGQYTQLSQVSKADAQQLSNQLDKVTKLSKELAKKDAQLVRDQEEIDVLRTNLEAREQRVEELEAIIAQLEKASNSLKEKISKALLGFKENDLSVEIKGGKIYVSLAEDLLFKSGSYSLDVKGKEALKKIATVLKDQDSITVIVEGHTDDVPYRPGEVIKDNWDLSVLRATSIVKELTVSGLNPKKVAASGRGEYLPKELGETKEVRAKNRRSEIIISPNLAELFNLLEQENKKN